MAAGRQDRDGGAYRQLEEDEMRGTLVCGVNDNDDGRAALEMAVELSERLGLRLVLAHARDGHRASTATPTAPRACR